MPVTRHTLIASFVALAALTACDGDENTAADTAVDSTETVEDTTEGSGDVQDATVDTEDGSGDADIDGDADAEDGSGDVADDTDTGPTIPEAVPGEAATVEEGTPTRTIGEEGPCGVPTLVLERGLRRSPYVQSVFTDTARIAWTDTVGASGSVRYSVAGSDMWRTVDANVRLFTTEETTDTEDYNAYDATLLGLEEDSDICYEVYVDGALLMFGGAFHSAWSSHEKPITILTMGDSGNASDEQRAIRDRMMEHDGDVFLHLGDMAYGDGTFPEFEERVFQIYESLMANIPVWPTPGNHEYKTNNAQPYLDVYYLPEQAWRAEDQEYYYSFDYGNVHFVSLDSNEFMYVTTIGPRTDDMIDWLVDDLENTDADWIIAFLHHPPYSSGSHGDMQWVQSAYVPIFEEYGVDLVLAGHDHNYERTYGLWEGEVAEDPIRGITYIVAGAGGASVRDVEEPSWYTETYNDQVHNFTKFVIDGCTGTGTTIDLDGNTIDGFTIDGCDN